MTQPAAKSKKQTRRRRARGSLVLIASLFIVSATIRFGEGVGLAFAAAGKDAPEAKTCVPDEDGMALLRAVQERERKVTEREGALADRRQSLDIGEKRVQDRKRERDPDQGRRLLRMPRERDRHRGIGQYPRRRRDRFGMFAERERSFQRHTA